MAKKKVRYTSKDKPKKLLTLSGKVSLQFVDEEAIAAPEKGDVVLFPKCDAWPESDDVAYDATGASGYFKVDVWDGQKWCPVVLAEIFERREHYFGKKELPIDCYDVCRDVLLSLTGRQLCRTYREHYELVDEDD